MRRAAILKSVLVLLLSMTAAIFSQPAEPSEGSTSRGGERRRNWSGIWETTCGRMELGQVDNMVVGRYSQDQGRISGDARDGVLTFVWSVEEADGSVVSGSGEFEMAFDNESFSGWWGSGDKKTREEWEGVRIGEREIEGTRATVDRCLWRGTWATEYGPVVFSQEMEDETVGGEFVWRDEYGTLSGTADGWTLDFEWTSGDEAGYGEFEMSDDLGSFSGTLEGFEEEPIDVRDGVFVSAELQEDLDSTVR